MSDLRTQNEKNSLVQHWQKDHWDKDSPPKYAFHVMKRCQTSLQRQIWEAILIDAEHGSSEHAISQKGEFGVNLVPKMLPTLDGEVKITNQDPGKPSNKREAPKDVQSVQNLIQNEFEQQYSQRRKRSRMLKDVTGVESDRQE